MNQDQIKFLKKTSLRICADLALFGFMFVLPWWATIVLFAIGMFVFDYFLEVLVMAFILDGYTGVPGETFYGLNSLLVSITGALFIVSIFLKTRLKFY